MVKKDLTPGSKLAIIKEHVLFVTGVIENQMKTLKVVIDHLPPVNYHEIESYNRQLLALKSKLAAYRDISNIINALEILGNTRVSKRA